MVDTVIVGSIALDSIQTPFGSVSDVLGGSTVYASFAASYFCVPGIVAPVGKDFPKQYLDLLKNKKIDISGVQINDKTFRWSGKYEYDMNEAKTLKTELNCLEFFKPDLPKKYREIEFLFLGNIDPGIQLDVLKQVKNPKYVMMDSMNFWIKNKKDVVTEAISKVDTLILNDAEMRELFNTASLVKAAKDALELGPKFVIIKKGEHGSLMFSKDAHFSAPSYPLEKLVDPTGAGDSFAGAIMGYLAARKEVTEKILRRAMVYGSSIASINAEGFGMERLKNTAIAQIESRVRELEEITKF